MRLLPVSNLKRGEVTGRGFSLVEALIVIAIIGILARLALPVVGGFSRASNAHTAALELASAGQLVRERSRAGWLNSSQGIFFFLGPGANSYTIFVGSSYATRLATRDIVTPLPTDLRLTLNGLGSEIIFPARLGQPTSSGSVDVKNSANQGGRVTFFTDGLMEVKDL